MKRQKTLIALIVCFIIGLGVCILILGRQNMALKIRIENIKKVQLGDSAAYNYDKSLDNPSAIFEVAYQDKNIDIEDSKYKTDLFKLCAEKETSIYYHNTSSYAVKVNFNKKRLTKETEVTSFIVEPEEEVQIIVSDIPSGTYFVSLNTGGLKHIKGEIKVLQFQGH